MTKNDCFYGIYPIRVVRHDKAKDLELVYKKHSFSCWEIEDLFFEVWRSDPDYLTANLTTDNTTQAAFSTWMIKHGKKVKNVLNYRIELENAKHK